MTFQLLLYILLFFTAMAVAASGKNALRNGFYVWIGMFLLGYRTIHFTSDFSLHPLILGLFLLLLLYSLEINQSSSFTNKLPGLLKLFIIFCFWGFVPGLINDNPWPIMISDSLNVFLLVPLFLIMFRLSKQTGFWKNSSMLFLASGVMISFLGTLEYFWPPFRNLIPGLVATNGVVSFISVNGFNRAGFAFWGATPAVLIVAMALPMVFMVPKFYKGIFAKILSVPILAILLVGIYISGTRVAWLMVILTAIFMAYHFYKFFGLLLALIVAGFSYSFLPPDAVQLVTSISTPLQTGQFLDSSMATRFSRQQDAFALTIQNPWGVGWSGSGWVHGDFIQFAANLGIIAGIVFLVWYLQTLRRALLEYFRDPKNIFLAVIILSFVLGGFVLATEGVQVLAQFAMPVWFVWGLTESYLQDIKFRTSNEGINVKNNGFTTNIQRRKNGRRLPGVREVGG